MDNPMLLGSMVGVIVMVPTIFLVYYIHSKKGHKAADKFSMYFGLGVALVLMVAFIVASQL